MKIKITKTPSFKTHPWRVSINGRDHQFQQHSVALAFVQKKLIREYKETNAKKMLSEIALNLLSAKDFDFIRSINKRGVAGINKKQYGYLKGIHERQEREW